jgi:hypothetical protein
VFIIECRLTFQRYMLPPSSGWEAARTSEMSIEIQLRTQQYIPEDSDLPNLNRCVMALFICTEP